MLPGHDGGPDHIAGLQHVPDPLQLTDQRRAALRHQDSANGSGESCPEAKVQRVCVRRPHGLRPEVLNAQVNLQPSLCGPRCVGEGPILHQDEVGGSGGIDRAVALLEPGVQRLQHKLAVRLAVGLHAGGEDHGREDLAVRGGGSKNHHRGGVFLPLDEPDGVVGPRRSR